MKAQVIDVYDREVINKMLGIYSEFLAETKYPITANREKAWERFFYTIQDPDGGIIVAIDDDGSIMGGAVVYAVADWQDEIFGYVEKFFVSPRYRGKGAGRIIADRVCQWFDEKKAVLSFATATANIGASGQFRNLMAKYGYQDLGPTLAREYQHGKI